MEADQTPKGRCTAENIDLVRLLFVTMSGATRAHAVDASGVDDAVDGGVTLSKLVQTYNALGRRRKDGRFDAAGEVRLRPDPETFRALPYADRCGAMLCDISTLDGEPWAVDPRASLRARVDAMAAEGLSPAVAFESEFHLLGEDENGAIERVDERGAYSTESLRETHDLVLAAVDALKAQGIDVKKYYPEYAAGKHEIVTGHAPGVDAADEYVLCKETVKSVAANRGLRATFLP